MSKTSNYQKVDCLTTYRKSLKIVVKPKYNKPQAEVFNPYLKPKYFKELGIKYEQEI